MPSVTRGKRPFAPSQRAHAGWGSGPARVRAGRGQGGAVNGGTAAARVRGTVPLPAMQKPLNLDLFWYARTRPLPWYDRT